MKRMDISKNIQIFSFAILANMFYLDLAFGASSAFTFPKTIGRYGAGTAALHFVDSGRGGREFMAQVWYPTDWLSVEDFFVSETPPAEQGSTYADEYFMMYLKSGFSRFGFDEKDLKELDSIVVRAKRNAAFYDDAGHGFPLLVFTPAYGCSRFLYSALCEQIASRGYVVVVIDHPNYAPISQLPDGRICRSAELSYSDKGAYFYQQSQLMVGDILFVIDQMLRWSEPKSKSIFSGKINEESVGVLGHSLGASIAVQACFVCANIKAVAALDGVVCGPYLAEGFDVPFLYMSVDGTSGVMEYEAAKIIEQIWKLKQERFFSYHRLFNCRVNLKSADHMIFTDFALLKHMSFVQRLQGREQKLGAGDLDGFKALGLVSFYLTEFFDKYLVADDSGVTYKFGVCGNNDLEVFFK